MIHREKAWHPGVARGCRPRIRVIGANHDLARPIQRYQMAQGLAREDQRIEVELLQILCGPLVEWSNLREASSSLPTLAPTEPPRNPRVLTPSSNCSAARSGCCNATVASPTNRSGEAAQIAASPSFCALISLRARSWSRAYQNGLMLSTSTSIPRASISRRRSGPMVSARFADGGFAHHLPDARNLAVGVHVHRRDPAPAHHDLPTPSRACWLHTGGRRTADAAAHDRHSRHRARRIPDEVPAGQHLFLLSRRTYLRLWHPGALSWVDRFRVRASSSGIGPCEIRSASVGPSTNSSTSARVPSDSSMPWICAIFGWLRLARICASRVNRARRSGSSAKASGRIFSATWRLSWVSVARQTTDVGVHRAGVPDGRSGWPRASHGPR